MCNLPHRNREWMKCQVSSLHDFFHSSCRKNEQWQKYYHFKFRKTLQFGSHAVQNTSTTFSALGRNYLIAYLYPLPNTQMLSRFSYSAVSDLLDHKFCRIGLDNRLVQANDVHNKAESENNVITIHCHQPSLFCQNI